MHNFNSQPLKDKVAIVTGGSRGIGKAIAFTLAENGANVIICARNIDELKRTSELIKKTGGSCYYIAADISDKRHVDSLVNETLNNFDHIDILINNAGIGVYKPFISSTLDDWERIINTNLRGAFLCTRAFAPSMMKQKKGYIINIISGAGESGFKNLSVYCASKFGLMGLTKSIQKELKEYGIKVLYFCPGYVRTDFFKEFPSDFRLPSKVAEPADIAKKVLRTIIRQEKMKQYWTIFTRLKEYI